MTSIEETKNFSAVTYDGSAYNFVVTPNGEIFCNEFGLETPASIIELKPNFVLRAKNQSSICSLDDYVRKQNKNKSLISQFIIDDELFEYLISNRMLMYSVDMAHLYGFDPEYAHDTHYQKRAYKHKKRDKVLAMQRQGKFH